MCESLNRSRIATWSRSMAGYLFTAACLIAPLGVAECARAQTATAATLQAALPEDGVPPRPIAALPAEPLQTPAAAQPSAATTDDAVTNEDEANHEQLNTEPAAAASTAAANTPAVAQATSAAATLAAAVADDQQAALPAASEVVSQAQIASLEAEDLQNAQQTDELPSNPEVAEVRNLSVEPGTRPLLPEDHPAWIESGPDYSTDIHRLPVSSLPTTNRADADEALDEPMLAALYSYVDERLIGELGAGAQLSQQLTTDYIRKNLLDEPAGYVAELATSNGPMYQKWVNLTITPKQREQIQAWHAEAIQRSRLAPLALGLLAAISFVGVSHVALRRRHGLPGSQPLSHEQFVSSAAGDPPRQRGRRSRRIGVLAILLCVGLLPAVVMSPLLLWTTRQQVPVREHRHVNELGQITERIEVLDGQEIKTMVITSPPPVIAPPHPPRVDWSSQDDAMTVTTGDQIITIRNH